MEVKEGVVVWVKVEVGKEVIVKVEVRDGVGRISIGPQLEIIPLHTQYNAISATINEVLNCFGRFIILSLSSF